MLIFWDLLNLVLNVVKYTGHIMICHNCGGKLEKVITDLPFKVRHDCIIIIKELPVLQCQNCNEYLIEDSVIENVDRILDKIDRTAELEIHSYAV